MLFLVAKADSRESRRQRDRITRNAVGNIGLDDGVRAVNAERVGDDGNALDR